MKPAFRHLLSLLIALGVIIAFWPLGQTAYARWSQARLRAEWQEQAGQRREALSASPGAPKARVKKPAANAGKPHKASSQKPKFTARHWPATRIVSYDMGLDAVVVQGMDENALRQGPGHDPRTALPGEVGNCVISGHRNVYGSHFYKIDELLPGSEITLSTPQGDYTYKMVLMYSVPDNDTSLYKPIDPTIPQLTIITCTLPHTVERVIIVAQMQQQ